MARPPRQKVDPLNYQTPIVTPDGKPTLQFRQLWERLFGNEGNTFATKADKSIEIIAGTNLSGGGDLSANRTLNVSGNAAGGGLQMSTGRLLGRSTAASGPIEEIELGTGLSFTGTVLNASGGGGGGWQLVTSATIASTTTFFPVTGLAGYNELRVVIRSTTSTLSSQRLIQVSTDNGTSYFATSGNYRIGQQETAATSVQMTTLAGTAARTAFVDIMSADIGSSERLIVAPLRSADAQCVFTGSAAEINAIRLSCSTGDLTGGTVVVFGR